MDGADGSGMLYLTKMKEHVFFFFFSDPQFFRHLLWMVIGPMQLKKQMIPLRNYNI